MTAVVIPSLGAPVLGQCLAAVRRQVPPADQVVVVISAAPATAAGETDAEVVHSPRRLGFAAAANLGMSRVLDHHDRVAVLNDDARPEPGWLAAVGGELAGDAKLAAVQGSVVDGDGDLVDGRGISFDPWGLPVQVDRGLAAEPEPRTPRDLLAVSATAAIFRSPALRQAALAGQQIFDQSFGSYHEDLDLGLRLHRLGWRARWTPGASCLHLGSATGTRLRWHHPRWMLANRWRALAGNLRPATLILALPRLLRGELRAIRSLQRSNPRTVIVAAWVLATLPLLMASGFRRPSAGPRLRRLPDPAS